MLVGTHVTLGIATALIATQPKTVSEVITAAIGGAVGGWVVDIDIKDRDKELDRENIYDSIIDGFVIASFVAVDSLIGNGMCNYIAENMGLRVLMGLVGLIALMAIGFNTKHRTFTHSFLALALFSGSMYLFCEPLAVPFALGYLSHMVADMFNKLGLQLFFPLKWRPCLKKCYSNKKANRILFRVALAVDVVVGGFLFASSLMRGDENTNVRQLLTENLLFGLPVLAVYLIVINIITFLGFQRSWRLSYREDLMKDDDDIRVQVEFETWLLDILAFIGGGIGMVVCLLIHGAIPTAENGNWWAFGYASIVLWSTIYCAVCNPLGMTTGPINLIAARHLGILLYLVIINIISAFAVSRTIHKKVKRYSTIHTFLWILGALGGTVGGILVALITHHNEKYSYASIGFFIMLISQTVLLYYVMTTGVI